MNLNAIAAPRISLSASLFIAVFFMVFASCKKTSNPNANMATFYFHLYPYIDSTQLTDTTALYKDSSGRYIGLNTAQFFIYNVVLQNANGSSYKVPDAYILTDLHSGAYFIGSAPPGTYTGVSFNVGLDAGTNSLQPTVFVPNGYAQSSTMYYPAGQGYMSMLLAGFADTAATLTDSGLVYFLYEISAQLYPEAVTMPARTGSPYQPYTATAQGTDTISIICDYGKLLSVVNFKTNVADTTDSYYINPSLAKPVANNIVNMFRYAK